MTFPAREQFDREHGDALARLYSYCRAHLSFVEVRELKGWVIARKAKIDRGNVTRMLNRLVALGFLLEHGRESEKQPRRFTLAYEVARQDDAA